MPSSLLQVVNNLLQQTRNKQCEHNLLTTCEQTCNNLLAVIMHILTEYHKQIKLGLLKFVYIQLV